MPCDRREKGETKWAQACSYRREMKGRGEGSKLKESDTGKRRGKTGEPAPLSGASKSSGVGDTAIPRKRMTADASIQTQCSQAGLPLPMKAQGRDWALDVTCFSAKVSKTTTKICDDYKEYSDGLCSTWESQHDLSISE